MSRKFDKISPKNISEEKFNQLIDSLPSSGLVSKENEQLQVKELKDPINSTSVVDSAVPVLASATDHEQSTGSNMINAVEQINDDFAEDANSLVEVFVYEVGKLSFGIPVSFVTEITNDYAPVSKLDGFIRSCLGTCEYREKLIPIFDSERAYLKSSKNGKIKKKHKKNLLKNPIITVEYEGVMFALTMASHVGLVKVELTQRGPQQSQASDEFLDQIVWYNDKNLYIFSPAKISEVVTRELKGQLVANQGSSLKSASEAGEQTDSSSIDYLIAKIRESHVAIEITKVLEVIEGFEVTSLYKVSEFIRGLINLRGQVLACIDLSKDLGFELMVIDERNKFIVISEAGSDFALCVDELIGIEALDGHVFQETEKVFPEQVAKFFPFFIEESDEIKLIMRPELFTNSESLLDYKKN